jgi:hypothetical protein
LMDVRRLHQVELMDVRRLRHPQVEVGAGVEGALGIR